MTVPESREVQEDRWYREGGAFRWCLPRFSVGKPADTTPRLVLNRYPHNVIGAGAVLFGRYWGVRWKK